MSVLAQMLPLLLWLLAGAAAAVAAFRFTRGSLNLVLLSVACALLVIPFVLLVPIGMSVQAVATESIGGTATAPAAYTQARETMFLESQGGVALRVLLVPVALATLPLLAWPAGRLRVPATALSAALLGAVVLLGAASLGLLYVPSALAAALALARQLD
jgi:hypothetical protein